MAMITKFRKWLDSVVNGFRCGMYGHQEIVVLHTYEPEIRARNFKGSELEKLTITQPYEEKIFVSKCRCLACSELFLRKRVAPVWPRQ
jgi:hypothetical protein